MIKEILVPFVPCSKAIFLNLWQYKNIKMNQAKISNLVSKLNITILPKARKLKNVNGPEGRILKLKKTLTELLKYERLELNYNRADETRSYIEQLISQALRSGLRDKQIMDVASFWILEKHLIYKFFNVLVPRYKNFATSYTKLYMSSRIYPGMYRKKVILELKGNQFPSVLTNSLNGDLLQNILLNEAKKEYRIEQYIKFVNNRVSQ